MIKNRIVVIDVETTGPDPFTHEILSVALLPYDKSLPHLSLNIEIAPNSAWASFGRENFNRFEDEWRASALSSTSAANAVQNFIDSLALDGPCILAGHNVAFDRTFLLKLAHAIGKDSFHGVSHRNLDTFSLILERVINENVPENALTSDGAFEYFLDKKYSADRHTALGDATLTRELLYKLFSD